MRLNESRTRPFQAPASVHTFPGRQVFVFPNGRSDSEESSEEELNVMELRPRGKEQARGSGRVRLGDVVLLERELTEEDSLNKLALQYGCKVRLCPGFLGSLKRVADIKRVNNFIREQDLYALKSIKIPVRPHGLLTESAGALRPPAAGPAQPGLTRVEPPEPDPGAGGSAGGQRLREYFRGIDQSIQDAVQVEVQLNAEYGGEALKRPLPEAGKRDAGNGADCGIQWWNAVFIMLLIGIVLPVFYIIYFKTQALVAHTSNMTNSNASTAG
ncbi:LysM and putative peptidoglycan-binding domain-containing protein 4 [Lonchura striata]|uniref:LysM and putative peptidoglycan-binding domain-containing protein 4 n=1 Tax=Lonchura striata TaxID=40157 RepID=A0A218V0E5_9PASE|nr:LysM and putative peptidoglycan-binding domain-containing protein 4 [Lonchura striata domestica]